MGYTGKTSILWGIDKIELEKIVVEANSLKNVLYRLGISNSSGRQNTLKNRLKNDNIDFNHLIKKEAYSNEEVFVENSLYARKHIKKRILKQNLIPYKCEICGNEGEWLGKSMVLVLDHKNGVNNDNRIENLRFLCSNCNCQQSTFAGKNNRSGKTKTYCIDCGKEISMWSRRCKDCANGIKCNSNKPSKEQLLQDILSLSFVKVGLKYKVSDNAVRKWCIKYGLPIKYKDIQKLKHAGIV
jgi:hypothetical protein